MEIKKILIYKDKKFYWKEHDFHSSYGVLKEEDIKQAKSGSKIFSNTDKEFLVLDANFQDNLKKLKRGPAIMINKDIGPILANANLTKDSTVLEAGSGSGSLTINLARFCKEVISYEKNQQSCKIVETNLKKLDIENVKLINKDIQEATEKADTIILDLPNPEEYLETCHKLLSSKGYLITYLPTINQVDNLIKNSKNFIHEKTIETLERSWHIEKHRLRPKSQMIAHTAFLTFLRKV